MERGYPPMTSGAISAQATRISAWDAEISTHILRIESAKTHPLALAAWIVYYYS